MILSQKKFGSFRKRVSLFLTLILLFETIFPTVSFALTSGPATPEFSSFEPVATTNMVNEFSGDFTYNIPVLNIPGADGGGYAMSLSYHSGESLESEASWVGYGWTLNPGAINRSKRGFADDTKSKYKFYNDVPKNWTASVGMSIGDPEIFSTDIPVSVNAALRYNNYKGFGYTAGIGLSVKGIVSLGYSVSDGSGSYSARINPAGILKSMKDKKAKADADAKEKKADETLQGAEHKAATAAIQNELAQKKLDKSVGERLGGGIGASLSSYAMNTFGSENMSTSITPYVGSSFNVSLNSTLDPMCFPIGITVGLNGNYSQQKNVPIIERDCLGYMYSKDAYTDEKAMMDYYTEKDAPFNKRDQYMSIPFSNADSYSVSGEGLSGGFRLHSNTVGRFRPNSMQSITPIVQVGVEVNLGLNIGVGMDVGTGVQYMHYFGNRWMPSTSSIEAFDKYRFPAEGHDNYFMRFSNDLGGDIDFGNDKVTTAHVVKYLPPILTTSGSGQTSQPESMVSTIDNGNTTISRSGRSSYIDYNTFGALKTVSNNKYVYAYDKSATTKYYRNLLPTSKDNQIGEIATVNEDGQTYVYGLTASSKKEKSLTYDMTGAAVINRFNALKDVEANHKMKVGTTTEDDYVTTYMLTQITTPDYVDRTLNGPTDDDFGGYTKFQYKKLHDNYHWRMPYYGFNYNKGNQSNQDDDMGSYTSGDKEIFYLDTIYTKTHIAIFYKSFRNDGLEAASDLLSDNSQVPELGADKLMKLDSICLFVNNGNGVIGKKIKKTCFQYDYSLCDNVPNNATAGTKGKLTLKKIWFEYEGVSQAKISPYIFDYSYANPVNYPFPYSDNANPNKFSEYNAIISTGTQNPSYNVCDIDAWGNYQNAGVARYNSQQLHLDQTPSNDFDPAAWQLKRITLPSGGEIHVQYEQDDYQYVQDRRAMALVNLLPSTSNAPNSYQLDVDNCLGFHTAAEKTELVNLINDVCGLNDKMYFKFLYTLIGNNVPDLNSCNAEYITGYVNTYAAIDPSSGNIEITFNGSGSYKLPREICQDRVKKELGGKINPGGNCNPNDGISDGGGAKAIVSQLVSKMGTIFTPNNLCVELNPALSYFKIPLLKAKKGGGLRVKRLLMYDADGVDDGQKALYGTEYIYKLENGESSGVATNEPAAIREENPLVGFLPKRTNQSFVDKAISGEDKDQFEGPLGESILPSPSVGYSRVVSKNIHNGKTNTGFIVSEFYTAKDFPFDMVYGDGTNNVFSGQGVAHSQLNDQTLDKFWLNIPAVFVNLSCNNYWAAQGYRFVKNNMHGQPKSVATYAGDYLPGAPNLANKSSSTEYEYFAPGEKLPVLKDDGNLDWKELGKETEVAMETRGVEDITFDVNTELDMSMGFLPPAVFLLNFSFSMNLNYSEKRLYTHVTSKVVNFPAIQKKVTQTQDGIKHVTENTLFSRFTGKPIKTISYDGFDTKNLEQSLAHNGIYTNYQITGYSQYKELGQKAINQRLIITPSPFNLIVDFQGSGSGPYTLEFKKGSSSSTTELCNAMGALTIGDLLMIELAGKKYFFHVDNINGTKVNILPSGNYNISVTSFITGNLDRIEVVSSGRTNQLNQNVGNYTTYGGSSLSSNYTGNTTTRQNFVNLLNTAIGYCASGTGNLGGNNHVLQVNSADIDFINPSTGLCGHGLEQDYSIRLEYISGDPARIGFRIHQVEDMSQGDVCGNFEAYLLYPGHFILDDASGKIKYVQDAVPCVSYDVKCLEFCSPGGLNNAITNVVSSSSSTMNHYWPYDGSIFDSGNLNANKNEFETGVKGKWRPSSTYTYKESVVGGAIENTSTHQRIYKNAGTYTMQLFNWKNPGINDTTKWIRTSTVTMYSPNGSALEEKDANHFYSSAKYGYKQTLPYMIANNATYKSVAFESFENVYSLSGGIYKLEDNLSVNNSNVTSLYSHSGKKSYILGASSFTFAVSDLTTQMTNAGVSCKVWVKDPSYSSLPISGNVNGNSFTFYKLAQTGEWSLYEAKVTNLGSSGSQNFVITNNIASQPNIYIDDIRMQPLNASANAYVYDVVTKRLLTSFDDQHFGLFYQYNKEGKLVRKIKETERGMKTIAETQYNIPKTAR